MPPPKQTRLVRHCFVALRHGLPEEVVNQLFVQWYRSCIETGTHSGTSIQDYEWTMLKALLLPTIDRPTSEDTSTNWNESSPSSVGCNKKPDDTHILYNYIPRVMEVLHLLYEDFKLHNNLHKELRYLADFLYTVAVAAQAIQYKLHYLHDFPELNNQLSTCVTQLNEARLVSKIKENSLHIPNILCSLEAFIHVRQEMSGSQQQGSPEFIPYPHIAGVNDRSRDMVALVQLMDTPEAGLKLLIERGYTREVIYDLPVTMRDAIDEMLEPLRQSIAHGQDAAVYGLLCRPDLHEHAVSAGIATSGSLRIQPSELVIVEATRQLELGDGMDSLDGELLRVYFPFDDRMTTVRSYLDSTKPELVDVPRDADGELKQAFEQEYALFGLLQRTLALPTGRGMLTMFTCGRYNMEKMEVPRICYTGRNTPEGEVIVLNELACMLPDLALWPSFHNGVAAGLRLCPDAPNSSPHWIQRRTNPAFPSEANAEQGGLLLAFGLSGHLRNMNGLDIYEYLESAEDLVRIGTLLGLSAAYRGTREPRTGHALLDNILEPHEVDRSLDKTLQAAALFGLGLLFQGTAERNPVEYLLHQLERPCYVQTRPELCSESHFLSAGLGLGLLLLGRADQLDEIQDLAVPARLFRCMEGAQHISKDAVCKMAPGVTLALGFTFFGTCNSSISCMLSPVNALFWDHPPHLLLLRVIAYHLVHWDEIRPTERWVAEQPVPQIVIDTVAHVLNEEQELDHDRIDYHQHCQMYCFILCCRAVAIGLRFAGSADPIAAATLDRYMRYFVNLHQSYLTNSCTSATARFAEFVGIRTMNVCQQTTLLALSLVVAGTGDLRVVRAVRLIRSDTNACGVTHGSQVAVHMALGLTFLGGGRYTLSRSPSAIAAIVCAIFPEFAMLSTDNRYYLQALRHLYVLAVEPRLFVPRRIDNGRLTQCLIRYAHRNSNTIDTRPAPCMLPELHTLEWVEVCDHKFQRVRFDASNWNLLKKILDKRGCIDLEQFRCLREILYPFPME